MRRISQLLVLIFSGFISLSAEANEEEASPQSDEDFQNELLTIEEKVNSLKKNVFGAKATLNLLRELVVQSSVSGSNANVWQINELGGTYAVTSVSYMLDGESIKRASDSSGENNKKREQMIFDGDMGVGDHTLAVEYELVGQGRGLFSYVSDYKFAVRSSTTFSSKEGENCVVRVVLSARSPLTYSYEERPHIDFQPICSKMGE